MVVNPMDVEMVGWRLDGWMDGWMDARFEKGDTKRMDDRPVP